MLTGQPHGAIMREGRHAIRDPTCDWRDAMKRSNRFPLSIHGRDKRWRYSVYVPLFSNTDKPILLSSIEIWRGSETIDITASSSSCRLWRVCRSMLTVLNFLFPQREIDIDTVVSRSIDTRSRSTNQRSVRRHVISNIWQRCATARDTSLDERSFPSLYASRI